MGEAIPEAGLASDLLLEVATRSGSRSPAVPPGAPRLRTRAWLVHRALVAADVIALGCAFVAAEILDGTFARVDHGRGLPETLLFVLTLPVWIAMAKAHGLYDNDEERASHTTADEIAGVIRLITLTIWIFLAAGWATGLAKPSTQKLLIFWAVAIALISLARSVARTLSRRSPLYTQNTLIVGSGHVAQLIAQKFLDHPEHGVHVLGYLETDADVSASAGQVLPVLGGADALEDVVRRLEVERVIVAFPRARDSENIALVRTLQSLGIRYDIVPRLFEVIADNALVHMVEGLPLLTSPPARLSGPARSVKRLMDVLFATCGLLFLAVPFALIAIAIKIDTRGPVFFRQRRMGCADRPFRIFKFRTMCAGAESQQDELRHLNLHKDVDPRMFKALDDPRVTAVGRHLRRLCLDELPQLINVLRGDMSLVGPRPLVLEEDEYVREWARQRLKIKPGMTGLWQVLGASDIPFAEMTRLDYVYLTTWSLWGDVKLLLRTTPAILRKQRVF